MDTVALSVKKHLSKICGENVSNIEHNVAELLDAFRTCKTDVIKKYLDLGLDPNLSLCGNLFFLTYLMSESISSYWPDIAKILINHGAKLDICDDKGTPLVVNFIASGESELLEFVLSKEFDLKSNAKKCVLAAVHYRQPDSLKILLDKGVDINISDEDGNTPLMWAVSRSSDTGMQGLHSCLKLLVAHGAGINISNNNGHTPLMASCIIREIETVKYLLSSGADTEVIDKKQETALMKAVVNDSVGIVKILISYGANINARNQLALTPLMMASSSSALETLILAGGDVNAIDQDGQSVLQHQTESDNREHVTMLLEFGADQFTENGDGDTPLQIAVRRKASKSIFVLLNAGSSGGYFNKVKDIGIIHESMLPWDYFHTINIFPKLNTPKLWREVLFYTSEHRELTHRLLNSLVKIPENVNMTGEGQITPLMLAAGIGDLKAVQLLIENKADPFLRDAGGRTCLSYAAKSGRRQIAALLLRKGCEPNLEDDDGNLPIYYAAFYSHTPIVLLLTLQFAYYYCSFHKL